jgi:hypothetical protein
VKTGEFFGQKKEPKKEHPKIIIGFEMNNTKIGSLEFPMFSDFSI